MKEVIKKNKSNDTNGDGLPDVVKYVGQDTDNNWYPISPNSITDNRESEAGGVAHESERESFYLKDLIKVLAQAKGNYEWWDYTKNELKLNKFLELASTETQKTDKDGHPLVDEHGAPIMEVTGFTIPSHRLYIATI